MSFLSPRALVLPAVALAVIVALSQTQASQTQAAQTQAGTRVVETTVHRAAICTMATLDTACTLATNAGTTVLR